MSEITANLNWLAIAIGTVVSFLMGWLWYSPKLFGAKWAAGNNIELASCDNPMPVVPLVMQLIATFFLAWLIGVTAASNALLTAFLILISIALLIAANDIFSNKSNTVVWIDASFIIVMGIVMILCHAIFS